MQYYSPSGALIGKREKSHMAEFSSNPDSRKKGEISFATYMKRLKEQKSCSDSYRVTINKIRNMKGLLLFKDIDVFLQIVDESGFDIGDEELQKYLLDYEVKEYTPLIENNQQAIKIVQKIKIKKISVNKVVEAENTKKIIEIDIMKFLKKIVPFYENNLQNIPETYQKVQTSIEQYMNLNNIHRSDSDKLFSINVILKNAFSYNFWSMHYENLKYETFMELFEYYIQLKRAKKVMNRNQLVKISEALLRVQRSILSLNSNCEQYDNKVRAKLDNLKERYIPIN